MKTKRLLHFTLFFVFIMLTYSCSSSSEEDNTHVNIQDISFTEGSQFTIPYNEEYILQAEVNISPSNAITPDLLWSSSNPEVEILDTKGGACRLIGTVEGVKSTIVASSPDGSITSKIEISVSKTYIRLKSAEGYLRIKPGETLQMQYDIMDQDIKIEEATWDSENTDIIAIDQKTGLLTSKSIGKANVLLRVQTSMGEMLIKEEVIVDNEIPLTGLYFKVISGSSETEYEVDNINNVRQLRAKFIDKKYVYVEVMYIPQNTTYSLPEDGSVNPWSDGGLGKFNTNSAQGGTGRTDRKVVRLLPKLTGQDELRAFINGISATMTVIIY